MNTASENQNELFSCYDEIPTEYDPFCNSTESQMYRENYSHVIPTFFFRTAPSSRKPSLYEKKKLKYFYNTTGILLSAKLIIEAASCILFYIIMFLCSFLQTHSLSLYYSALSDATVRYSFMTISVILSVSSVFLSGCRCSYISPERLLKKNKAVKTSDVILFFMTGIFIMSLQNISDISVSHFLGKNVGGGNFSDDTRQMIIIALYTCIVVPVSSGLIFRGIALKNLSRAGQRFGILASSFLCALSSGKLTELIPCFLMSVMLSKLTVKYDTVTPSIFIHMTINICCTIIAVYGSVMSDTGVLIKQVWTATAFIFGGIFAVAYMIKEPLPKSTPAQRKRTVPLFAGSIFIILLIALYILAGTVEIFRFMYL